MGAVTQEVNIQMLEKLADGNFKKKNPETKASQVKEETNKRFMTDIERTKLAGIEAGANKYVHPGSGTNPHGTTKADVGLGNVDNVKQLPIAGGTMTGILTAQSNTSYTTRQARNIRFKTGADFTTSELAVGEIGFIY